MNIRYYSQFCVSTGLVMSVLAATSANAAFVESFEGFQGASGTTIDGYSNSIGNWDANATFCGVAEYSSHAPIQRITTQSPPYQPAVVF